MMTDIALGRKAVAAKLNKAHKPLAHVTVILETGEEPTRARQSED